MADTGNGLTNTIGRSKNSRADLHVHSTYSDGFFSPQELIQRARKCNLSVISLTDHDHVGGIAEAIEEGKRYGIEVVPGVELSVALNDKDIHLLAYFFDYTDKHLLDYLAFFRHERLKRAERIVQKLNNINIPLKINSVLEQAGIGSVGRPHIASALVEEGLIDSYHDAFMRYIGVGAPAYEKKYQLSPKEATKLVSDAGGLTFLAHPGKYTTEFELSELIQAGVDGIEVVHPSHPESRQDFYRNVVQQYFLLECGGSDFHGGKKNDDDVFGKFTVSLDVVEEMRTRLFS
jgi:predicted metal-dependent phosphoesterase TrpH